MIASAVLRGEKLLEILQAEHAVLQNMYEDQKSVRKAVTTRSWDDLQSCIYRIDSFSSQFVQLENEREALFKELGSADGSDVYRILPHIPKTMRDDIKNTFHRIKQTLAASKIENEAINEYISVSKEFMQSVFDKVLPRRKNVVYSNKGSIVRNKPDSIIINTIM